MDQYVSTFSTQLKNKYLTLPNTVAFGTPTLKPGSSSPNSGAIADTPAVELRAVKEDGTDCTNDEPPGPPTTPNEPEPEPPAFI